MVKDYIVKFMQVLEILLLLGDFLFFGMFFGLMYFCFDEDEEFF